MITLNAKEIARVISDDRVIFLEADESHDDIRDLLSDTLRAELPEESGFFSWIVEVWDDAFVYEYDTPSSSKMFKRTYVVAEDGTMTFGEPVEVERVVEFVPVVAAPVVEAVSDTQVGEVIQLTEAIVPGSDFTPQIMSLIEKSVRKDGTVPIKLIKPGWGSSAYYSADVLEQTGPTAFPKGTHMFWDHMTEAEMAEQPEGELNNLAAVFESDARWEPNHPNGPGLYTDAKMFGEYRDKVDELAPHIGTSINTSGLAESGEVDGREGYIVTELLNTPFTSTDFVTKAGAGGEIVSLFESARPQRKQKEAIPMPDEITLEETQTKLTEAETENAELKVKVEESEAEKVELARFREAELTTKAQEVASEVLKDIELLDPTKTRIIESVSATPPLKEGELDTEALQEATRQAATDEATYLEGITGAGNVTDLGGGGGGDDADKTLRESVKRYHPDWSDDMIENYVTG